MPLLIFVFVMYCLQLFWTVLVLEVWCLLQLFWSVFESEWQQCLPLFGSVFAFENCLLVIVVFAPENCLLVIVVFAPENCLLQPSLLPFDESAFGLPYCIQSCCPLFLGFISR